MTKTTRRKQLFARIFSLKEPDDEKFTRLAQEYGMTQQTIKNIWYDHQLGMT